MECTTCQTENISHPSSSFFIFYFFLLFFFLIKDLLLAIFILQRTVLVYSMRTGYGCAGSVVVGLGSQVPPVAGCLAAGKACPGLYRTGLSWNSQGRATVL